MELSKCCRPLRMGGRCATGATVWSGSAGSATLPSEAYGNIHRDAIVCCANRSTPGGRPTWQRSRGAMLLLLPLFLLASCRNDSSAGIVTPPDTTEAARSFRGDVLPVFAKYGCLYCHGGTSGLTVGSVAALLKGGNHGPAIVPFNPSASILFQKLGTPAPFGDRMPPGSSAMPAAQVKILSDWVTQGARDN